MKTILFRCDATAHTGYGHLIRCVNLAKHFVLQGCTDIRFIGVFDEFSDRLLEDGNFKKSTLSHHADLGFLAAYNSPETLFIIDFYQVDNEYIETVSTYSCKKIYFDDGICPLDYENKADALISLRIERPSDNFPANLRLFSGLAHFIAAPEMAALREKNLSKWKTEHIQDKTKILIFISGKEEGKQIEKNILQSLDSLGLALKVFVIAAPQLYQDLPLLHIDLIRLNPTYKMYTYLSMIDFVISGGGLLKYEAAFCAIPEAIYAVTELQQEDTDLFCNAGLAYDLKAVGHSLSEHLSIFIKDSALKNRIIAQSEALFTTNCTEKLVTALVSL